MQCYIVASGSIEYYHVNKLNERVLECLIVFAVMNVFPRICIRIYQILYSLILSPFSTLFRQILVVSASCRAIR